MIQSASLGLHPSIEVKQLHVVFYSAWYMGRQLVLFGLQFSLTALCGICDWFYFTFSQNVIKSHLKNRKKEKTNVSVYWSLSRGIVKNKLVN